MKRTKNVMQESHTEVLAMLSTADRDALLTHWGQHFDLSPPQISTLMLRQVLMYKIQEHHYGALKPAVRRFLEKEAVGIPGDRNAVAARHAL